MLKTNHELYVTWRSMKARCYNPRATKYNLYGGRGIKVCERWFDFWSFVADVGDRPQGTTLDRINNDGDYEPGNVRWATYRQQNSHLRLGSNNKSGHKGVLLLKYRSGIKKWRAYIVVNKKQISLGYHKNYDEALSARLAAEIKYNA